MSTITFTPIIVAVLVLLVTTALLCYLFDERSEENSAVSEERDGYHLGYE